MTSKGAEAQRCTCPSGDGSLRWPCPAHPPEAQGGGESRHDVEDLLGQVALLAERINYSAGHDEAVTLSAELRQLVKKAMSIRNGLPLLRTAPPSAPVGVEAPADEFSGDTPHLIRCIESLLRLDAACALVPHGVGGHARTMLAAAAKRLAQQPTADDVDTEQFRRGWQAGFAEGRRDQQPAAVDGAIAEEMNEQAAIAAYEKYMGVSADDPAYGPDLSQWMAGWNAAIAAQPGGSA